MSAMSCCDALLHKQDAAYEKMYSLHIVSQAHHDADVEALREPICHSGPSMGDQAIPKPTA